ncbi:MAG: NAD-dependent epimerase/dehydratase family protein [Planctomycetota bacterium]
MNVLVLGGTRFFGLRLVRLLVDAGHHVTVATRGRAGDDLGTAIERLVVDRNDAAGLRAALDGRSWDLVYDQVGYSSANATDLLAALGDRAGHLVFTSSGAVYTRTGRPLTESEFDPTRYPARHATHEEVAYGEGKRLAEAVLFQRAPFPVTALRFPVVIGPDDYTRRMARFVARVREGRTLRLEDTGRLVSFVSSADAARQLFWAGTERRAGTFNGSCGPVTVQDLIATIESHVGRPAVVSTARVPATSYRIDRSSALAPDRAIDAGFRFLDSLAISLAAMDA